MGNAFMTSAPQIRLENNVYVNSTNLFLALGLMWLFIYEDYAT